MDALVGNQHESPMVAADHAREGDLAPSFPAPRHPVSNIPETAPQP
jgi:hypothetical protein